MKKFLVQIEEDGTPSFDFCFGMIMAKRYLTWSCCSEKPEMEFSTKANKKLENPDNYVPVGSIEFVEDFVRTNYGEEAVKVLKPCYPDFFGPYYLGGTKLGNPYEVANTLAQLSSSIALHVKSATKLKDDNNGNYSPSYILGKKDVYDKDNGWYYGTCVYPTTEWRVFVHDGTIFGIKNYNGNPWITPNEEVVKNLVTKYCDSIRYNANESTTFVLDVGVSPVNGATEVIEMHEFYSCGLYGFDLYEKLPFMFSKQWFHTLAKIKKAIS